MPAISTAQSKYLVRRYYEEVWNLGRLDVVDEIFTPDFEVVDLPSWREPGGAGLKAFIADNRRMFPDVRITVEDVVAEGDMVAVCHSATGTHEGDLVGPVGLVPATHRRIHWTGIVIFWVNADGRIHRSKGVIDNMSLMQQLGAVAPAAG